MYDSLFPPHSGGVIRRSDLLRAGLTVRQLQRAVEDGTLVQPCRGWYATPFADTDAVRAVRDGSVITCISALRRHGIWVFGRTPLHVRQSERRAGDPTPPKHGLHICAPPPRHALPFRTSVDSIPDALVVALACRPLWEVVAALDSVTNCNPWNPPPMMTAAEVTSLLTGYGRKAERALMLMNPTRDSGCETRFHLRLQKHQIKFRGQVVLCGRPVDTLIGDWLVVQVDGAEAHDNPDAHHSDREQDRVLTAAGFTVVRLTYRHTMFHLDAVMRDILVMIRRGDHLRPRKGVLVPESLPVVGIR